MKKLCAILVCVAAVLFLVSCANTGTQLSDGVGTDGTEAQSNTADTTEAACQHVFEETVYKEPGYGVNGINVSRCTLCGEYEYVEVPALPDIFELKVTAKNVYVQENTNECVVLFDIEIKNTSDKRIESILGNLSVCPPDCILELICDFDNISLDAYSTIHLDTFGYTFDCSLDADTVERKVCEAEFGDIKFYFSPTEVVVAE